MNSHNQSIAGLQVGEDKLLEAIIIAAGVGLVAVNAYHMATFLVAKLSSVDSNFVWIGILYVLGCSLALLEIPLARMLVTQYRLSPISFATVILGFVSCTVVSLAIVAGISSQSHSGHERDNEVLTHSLGGASLEARRAAIEADYKLALVRAKMISNAESKEYAEIKAASEYQNSLSMLASEVHANQAAQPSLMNQESPLVKKAISILFALVCSVGAMVLSAYHTIYVLPLIALPALSLVSKKDHEWQSDKTNFKSADHVISPLKNEAGTLPIGNAFRTVDAAKVNDKNISVSNTETYSPPTSDTNLNPSGRSLAVNTESDNLGKAYELIRQVIIAKKCKPTLRGVKDVLVKSNIKFVTDKARTEAINQVLDLLLKEGVIILNPKHGATGKVVAKYLLNENYKAGGNDMDNQPFNAKCPSCTAVVKVERVSDEGLVRCACDHVFKAVDHKA